MNQLKKADFKHLNSIIKYMKRRELTIDKTKRLGTKSQTTILMPPMRFLNPQQSIIDVASSCLYPPQCFLNY